MLCSHIFNTTRSNKDFRRVVFTNRYSQVVLMNIPVGEDIGFEKHAGDEVWFVVSGIGQAYINSEEREVTAGDAVVVPANTDHELVNVGESDLKLFSVFTPPAFRSGTLHATKAEALIDI